MACKGCKCVKVIAPFPPLNITRPMCAREFFVWLRDNYANDLPGLALPFEQWPAEAINQLAFEESKKPGTFLQIVE